MPHRWHILNHPSSTLSVITKLKSSLKCTQVFNLGKDNISLINIPIASLVNYFMIYIEYIMENYFAI